MAIALDTSGRPFVESELLRQRRKGQKHGRPYLFLRLHHGKGTVWAGEEAVEVEGEEDRAQTPVELTDARQLGIATPGTLKEHPRIKRFRDFLKSWYLSYFFPDAARSLPSAGPQRHLNIHGDNVGNVVQFMEREHKARFKAILDRIASKIPGIAGIDTLETPDKRECSEFLSELEAAAVVCRPSPDTLFRLAIEEIEAWYFGDRDAFLAAYPRAKLDVLGKYVQDSTCDTWELLADAVYVGGSAAIKKNGWPLPGQVKHEWAIKMGSLMNPDMNISPSFMKLRNGLRRLVAS